MLLNKEMKPKLIFSVIPELFKIGFFFFLLCADFYFLVYILESQREGSPIFNFSAAQALFIVSGWVAIPVL